MKQHSRFFARLAATILILSMVLSLGACGLSSSGSVKAGNLTEKIKAEKVEGKAAGTAFTSSQYDFAAKLLASSYEEDGGNCLVSPLSVLLALAMTANGAANKTLSQMLDVIGGGMTMEDLNAYLYGYVKNLPPSNKNSKLAIANSVWVNDLPGFAVREDFLRAAVSWYDAAVYQLPFDEQCVKEINGWVSKNTDKMIEEIMDSMDEDALMFLINAVCFDAKWEVPFTREDERKFTTDDGSTQYVDMMLSAEDEYFEGEHYTGFAKKYGNGCRFIAILPDEDTSLKDFIAGLDGETLAAILSSAVKTKVNIGLPKFSYDYAAKLKERLRAMGMTDAFEDSADFSLMCETEPLKIDDVIHKTFIEVAEAGTRAAAVTAVTMAPTAMMPTEEPKTVILDRPFLYMIVDGDSSLPIFIGTVGSVK